MQAGGSSSLGAGFGGKNLTYCLLGVSDPVLLVIKGVVSQLPALAIVLA